MILVSLEEFFKVFNPPRVKFFIIECGNYDEMGIWNGMLEPMVDSFNTFEKPAQLEKALKASVLRIETELAQKLSLESDPKNQELLLVDIKLQYKKLLKESFPTVKNIVDEQLDYGFYEMGYSISFTSIARFVDVCDLYLKKVSVVLKYGIKSASENPIIGTSLKSKASFSISKTFNTQKTFIITEENRSKTEALFTGLINGGFIDAATDFLFFSNAFSGLATEQLKIKWTKGAKGKSGSSLVLFFINLLITDKLIHPFRSEKAKNTAIRHVFVDSQGQAFKNLKQAADSNRRKDNQGSLSDEEGKLANLIDKTFGTTSFS